MIILCELLLVLLFLVGGKWLQDYLTTFDDDFELFTSDNPCLGIAKAGYYLAIAISCRALFLGQGNGDWTGVRDFAVYGFANLILLNCATYTFDRFILRSYKIYDEICKKRNEAVAWALFGGYVSSAFILQGAMSGDDAPLGDSLSDVFLYFGCGQVLLILGAKVFFYIHRQQSEALECGNTAAGLSFAGFLVGLGCLMGGICHGDLHVNAADVMFFVLEGLVSMTLLFVVRIYLFPYIFAKGTSLHREIYEDQNSAAGWIMGLGSLGFAQLALSAYLAYTN